MSHSIRHLLFSGAVFLTAALSVTNTALAGGVPTGGRAAVSPVQAVRALIHGYYYGPRGQRMRVPSHFASCFPIAMHVAACPVSHRFLQRLRHPDPRPAGCLGGCSLDSVSRSENTTQYLSIRLADNNGSVAHVNTRWSYTYNAPQYTFVVLRTATGWLVDDEYCTGYPATTVYKVPVRPCPGNRALITVSWEGRSTQTSSIGASRYLRAALVYATKDFGYWMTYAGHNRGAGPATVNANIAKYVSIRSDLPSGARVGHLVGLMHLMNEPSGFRYHVDSFTNARAVETIRWLFGSNPHTPIVRVVWTMSPVGWSITRATFLRLS